MELPSLVKTLKEKFPDKLPYKEVTPYELGVLVGQQETVNFLLSLLEQEGVDLTEFLKEV